MKLGSSLAWLALIALGGTLYTTNPSEAAYADYLSQTLSDEVQVALCAPEGFSNWLGKVGEVLSGACQEVLGNGRRLTAEEMQAMILANTERKNRYLFSTYTTELPLKTYESVGVFGRFFPKGLTDN